MGVDPKGRKQPLQGFMQALQPHKLRGWAWRPAGPEEHLRIEVRVDGALLTQTIASMTFPDLAKNGIGAGDHGFLIIPHEALPVDAPDRVRVTAVAADGSRKLLELSAGAKARAQTEPSPPGPGGGAARVPAGADATRAPARADATRVPAAADAAGPSARKGGGAPRPPARENAGGTTSAERDAAAMAPQRPLFILGSARSGTTAMMQALRATGLYEGHNEGHLLTMFPRLHQALSNHYARTQRDAAAGMNTAIAHVPRDMALAAIQGAMAAMTAALYPTGRWMDKTPGPEMIRAVPLLMPIWPQTRYIFMKRRPVDNIESRRRKFPSIGFADHCRLWADSMMSWHAIREELPGEAMLEVDQVRMGREPEGVAAEVARLLELDEAQTARLLASFHNDRPQRTGKEFAPEQTLDSVDWDEAQRQIFAEICTDAMVAFGYERDLDTDNAGRARSERPNRRKPASC